MDLSVQFKNYLLNQDTPASKATVKNYLSDVKRFTTWYEAKTGEQFKGTDVSYDLVDLFKSESLSSRSASSVERNISTLRKFFTFLKLEGIISESPFIAEKAINRETSNDPWMIRDFKNYLFVINASSLTIKNYIIDVNQFKQWLESTLPSEGADIHEVEAAIRIIDSRLISDYKHRLLENLRLNPTSVNRKLSSLRKYTSWAQEQGIINSDTKTVANSHVAALPLVIPASDPFDNQTPSVQQEKPYSNFPPLRLFQKSKRGIGLFLSSLFIAPLVYLVSQGNKISWIIKGKPIFEETRNNNPLQSVLQPLEAPVGPVRNIPKSFWAPTQISVANMPLQKQIWHHIRYTRPEWYRKYHSYTFTSYLHFSILILVIMLAGYTLFTNNKLNDNNSAVLASLTVAPERTLSFQGRITDDNGIPIKTGTNLRMSIYTSEDATGSALLWEEVDYANPDKNGIFNVLLGQENPIPQSLFSNNPALWLGVTVENTDELNPRQRIATVEYAANAKTLQGLEPIIGSTDTANVILALNSSGNLTIGGTASPTFRATGGDFTISGETLVLTSEQGSNGNIQISPDGDGLVDIQSAITNRSDNNSIIPGSVQIDDVLITNASTLNTAAFGVNQRSTGDLIIASTSGETRFLVDNGGNITTSGNINGLTVDSGTITSGAWSGAVIDPESGGTGLNTSSSTGVPYVSSGTWSIDSNHLNPNHGGTGLDTSSLTGIPIITSGTWSVDDDGLNTDQGGTGITSYNSGDILYANDVNNLTTLGIGGIGTCLSSNGSSPSWVTCGSFVNDSIWREAFGITFLNNSTLDFLVGGQSSDSAKFAILNVNEPRGNQIASLSGDFVFDKEASIQTTKNQTLTIGGDTTGDITIENNSTINIGTDATSADTIIVGNKNALTSVEIFGGNYDDWYIESSGAAKFNTFAGAGLYTDCDATGDKVVWDATTKQFACGIDNSGGGIQDVVHISDASDTPWVDNDTTELWDGATQPNITPTNTNNKLLIMVSIIADIAPASNDTESIPIARIDREIGSTADCADDNTIGSSFGFSAYDNNQTYNNQVATYTFVDSPATTNNVSYTICTSADSVLDGINTENQIEFTIIEVNDTESADFAEIYPTLDETLGAGEVVTLDPKMTTGVMRSTKAYEQNVIGVVSTQPAITIGGNNDESEHAVPIALAGRVPVKVSTVNGDINKGDYLTTSPFPGVAMKANKSGAAIGIAMDGYSSGKIGSILVFVQNGNTNGNIMSLLDTNNELSNERIGGEILTTLLSQQEEATPSAQSNILTDRLISAIEIISPKIIVDELNANKLKVAYYELGKLITETAIIATAQITDLSADSLSIATENITIAGENIREYIAGVVDERIDQQKIAISSPILETDEIKPTDNTLSILLPTSDKTSNFEVKNSSESAVFTVDAAGDATLSGTLSTDEIESKDASISGTLRAGRIDADELNLSDEALSDLQNSLIATSSPTINNYYYNDPQIEDEESNATGSATLKEITADYATFKNGLVSYGSTSFFDATVANRLFVGAQLSISDTSINVLGANLKIQPLRQGGIDFVGGKISIDVEGNLEVNGNAFFAKDVDIAGKLATNIIKVEAGKGLAFQFEDLEGKTSNIEFRTGTGSAVLTLNNQGDVNSSGSGTFNKLNLNIVPEAIALSDTEVIATGSAGTAEINPYQNELTINNPLITKDSLIYITPKTSLPNQSVYLLRQIAEESFTVGLSRVVEKAVPFNWIIIN